MDLLHAIGTFRKVLTVFAGTPDSEEPWAANEETFERHFGVPYEYFEVVLQHLSPEQVEKFEATLRVNPEAAVLWILSMEAVET
jgi:hypothetical protein